MSPCPGTGQRWMPGMGRAVCPVCKVSSWTLFDTPRDKRASAARRLLADRALVPEHQHASERNRA